MFSIPRNIVRAGRYIGIEPNRVVKEADRVDIRIALCYPDVYEIGMSYFGLFLLYELLNSLDGVWCERCFAPWHDMEAHLRAAGIPLTTLESRTPLSRMDVVGFSLTYELNVTNVLNMLSLGGIPLRSRERENGPLVIGGGPLTLNPVPYEPFFDLLVVGEAEGVLVDLASRLKGLKGLPRPAVIEGLAGLPGVYTPLLPKKRVRRLYIEDLDASFHPVRPPIPTMGSVHNRLNVEISRGCGNGCRFCIAGYGYRPYRERSPQRLAEIIDRAASETGFEEISFLSLSSGDYSCLPWLLSYVRQRHRHMSLSLPSLKIGSITEKEIDLLGAGARGGFTFALETSTQDLRDRLNKDIETDALMRQLPLLKSHGWRKVKLYFMVGFPWEEEADFLALRDLILPFVRLNMEVHLSVSPFTPKPHTPFQWLAMEDAGTLREKMGLVKRMASGRGVKVRMRDAPTSLIEALIARGDERLPSLFEDLHRKGVRLEAWSECFNPLLYDGWLDRASGPGAGLLGPRQKDAPLPWDFIETGVDKSFLLGEMERAERKEKTVDCYGACAACGLGCPCPRSADAAVSAAASDADQPAACPEPGLLWEGTPDANRTERAEQGFATSVFTLRYAKCGDSRHIGHLDTVEILLRAVRSSGISLKMHGKYHPKPRISLSPALPVGIESTCEMIEIERMGTHDIGPAEVRRIDAHLPKGMRILGVSPGRMAGQANGFGYLLVAGREIRGKATKVKERGERAFYEWRASGVKDLWLSGEFERIVKIEGRRIDGLRADHQRNLQ